MRRAAAVLLGAGLLGACAPPPSPRSPPAPPAATESVEVAEVRALLHRMHDEARERARPDRASLRRLLRLDDPALREAPAAARVRRTASNERVVVETWVFESEPGVPVTGTYWRPAGQGSPRPAVVVLHGHLEGDRRDAAVQARCLALVRKGFGALALDLFGHGERAPLGHREGFQLRAAGDSVLGLDARAVVRALDLLAARPDVDASRLGLLGQSGGAIVALHVAGADPRVAATFSCAGLHDFEDVVLTARQCPCNYAPRQLLLGTVADAAERIPPRALLASVGTNDPTVPPASALKAFEGVVAAAEAAGASEAVRLQLREGEAHRFTPTARRSAVAFFARRFGADAVAPASEEELAAGLIPAEVLAAWPAGPPADALSLAELAARRQRALRPAEPPPPRARRAGLAASLALPAPAPPAVRTEGGLVLETEPGFHLRAWTAGSDATAPLELVVEARGGRAALAERDGIAGRVLAVDLRGQGDAAGGAWDSLLLDVGAAAGAPLLGRRVHDLRGWLETARGLAGPPGLRLRASGEAAFAALLLAALEPERFEGAALVLDDLPATLFAEKGDDPRWGLPATLAVTGLAELGDVPELAALLPPGLVQRVELGRLRGRDGRVLEAGEPASRRLRAVFSPP